MNRAQLERTIRDLEHAISNAPTGHILTELRNLMATATGQLDLIKFYQSNLGHPF